jgi:hypothetical protein
MLSRDRLVAQCVPVRPPLSTSELSHRPSGTRLFHGCAYRSAHIRTHNLLYASGVVPRPRCTDIRFAHRSQHWRIISKGTSAGFSPWFLLLGSTGSASGMLNMYAARDELTVVKT